MNKRFTNFKNFLKRRNKILIIVIIVALIIVFAPIKKVEVGHEGILYNTMSGNVTSVQSSGWHIVCPIIQDLTSYPINERSYKIYRDTKNWNDGVDASIVVPTNDNQEVSLDVSFVYALDENMLLQIYEKFNGQEIEDIEEKYLKDIFKSSVISAVTQYSAYDVYSTKRGEIEAVIKAGLSEKLLESGIIIKDIYIETVRLSAEMESILKAEALAEAARIEAQGRSDANKLISDSLTNEIMTYESLQKMSDSLKLIIIPSGSEDQLDLTKIFEQILNSTKESEQSKDE